MPRKSKDGAKIRAAVRDLKALAKEHTQYLLESGNTKCLQAHANNLECVYRLAVYLEQGQFQKGHDLATKLEAVHKWYGKAGTPKVQMPSSLWELFEE